MSQKHTFIYCDAINSNKKVTSCKIHPYKKDKFSWIKHNKWMIILILSSPVLIKIIEWVSAYFTKINISGGNG